MLLLSHVCIAVELLKVMLFLSVLYCACSLRILKQVCPTHGLQASESLRLLNKVWKNAVPVKGDPYYLCRRAKKNQAENCFE